MLSSEPLQRVNTRSITSVTSEIRSLGHVSSSRLYAAPPALLLASPPPFTGLASALEPFPEKEKTGNLHDCTIAHPPSPRGCSDGLSIRFGAKASVRSFWSSNSQIPSWNVFLWCDFIDSWTSQVRERGALSTPFNLNAGVPANPLLYTL